MLIDPINLDFEADILTEKIGVNPYKNLIIDSYCPVITEYHKAMNLIKETLAGDKRKGSVGKGVGEAVNDAEFFKENTLVFGELADLDTVHWKLEGIRLRKLDVAEQLLENRPEAMSDAAVKLSFEKLQSPVYSELLTNVYGNIALSNDLVVDVEYEYLSDMLAENDSIFEGAQGVLLDRYNGFWPYVTQTKTTFDNALELISKCGFSGEVERIGVIRSYATRHGPGPFPTQDNELAMSIPDVHNVFGQWQRDFRIGWLDVILTKYALEVCGGVDSLAITNIDRLDNLKEVKASLEYDLPVGGYDSKSFAHSKRRLKISECFDKERQREMGGFLNACSPRLKVVDSKIGRRNFQGYISFLEKSLGVKSSILSFGPTANDKLFL